MKTIEIILQKTETEHLLSLIEDNEREGCYYGNAQQYWTRSDRIKIKLEEALRARGKAWA